MVIHKSLGVNRMFINLELSYPLFHEVKLGLLKYLFNTFKRIWTLYGIFIKLMTDK